MRKVAHITGSNYDWDDVEFAIKHSLCTRTRSGVRFHSQGGKAGKTFSIPSNNSGHMEIHRMELVDYPEAQMEESQSIEVTMPPPSQISSPRESKPTRPSNTPALSINDSAIGLTMLQWKMKVCATVKTTKTMK